MNRPFLIALAGFVALLLAIAIALWIRYGEEPLSSSPPIASSSPEKSIPQKPIEPANIPAFDIVRINPQGETVTAGRAMPRAEVSIMDNSEEIGRVIADNRGEWVFVPDKQLLPGNHELTLQAHNPDDTITKSSSPVILVVPETSKDGNAMAVKIGSDGSVNVLQAPGNKEESGLVAIIAVRLDEQGQLSATGKAAINSVLCLYLDSKLIHQTKSDDQGSWKATLKVGKMSNDDHKLRVDQIDNTGKVNARAEVTFNITPSVPASANEIPSTSHGVEKHPITITVAPGNSLWRIARRTYGSGVDYVMIYQANKGQIRDPDRIYPGQVFHLPPR